jgi:gliding motility-associated-like protein
VAPITTVDYPETVDLNTTITPVNGLTYTFWLDALATKPVENPSKILASGKFFVKAENSNHCRRILPMEVVVVPPPLPSLKSTNAFTPNGDGTNDTFRMELTGIIDLNYFKVFDRWGQVVFSGRSSSQAWDGKKDGIDVPTGTYYWVFDGYDRYYKQKVNSSGSVILIR